MKNIHKNSLSSLDKHMANHVNDAVIFKAWARQGLTQIHDDCSFCGQALSDDAQGLISAYQQAFDFEFDRFNSKVRETLNGLRQPFGIPSRRDSLVQQHHVNRQMFELYVEPKITENKTLVPLITLLEHKYEAILVSYDSVAKHGELAAKSCQPRLDKKFETPYEPAEPVSFEDLDSAAEIYNTGIHNYLVVTKEINSIFVAYKKALNEAELNLQMKGKIQEQVQASLALKRIKLEPLCDQYRQKRIVISELEASYKSEKQHLEDTQAKYLDTYFDSINDLFRKLGSRDFEIIKAPNRRGKQIIYELRVTFKGENISADRINSVFSESDRRALALCIFLAKIMILSAEERAKAILVLDDPVTSFDNERIELILMKFDVLQQTVKQLIVTTHYKGMAAKTAKKFRNRVKALTLVHRDKMCSIEEVSIENMTASDHDIEFDKIRAFVDGETNIDIRTNLRPFLESEIRLRFKRPLLDEGMTAFNDLSPCVEVLMKNGKIPVDVGVKLKSIINSLNTSMHETRDEALENTRSLAEQMLNLVYDDL